jgi:septal ring factor EnvC (AmiA/AmiB activator)
MKPPILLALLAATLSAPAQTLVINADALVLRAPISTNSAKKKPAKLTPQQAATARFDAALKCRIAQDDLWRSHTNQLAKLNADLAKKRAERKAQTDRIRLLRDTGKDPSTASLRQLDGEARGIEHQAAKVRLQITAIEDRYRRAIRPPGQ